MRTWVGISGVHCSSNCTYVRFYVTIVFGKPPPPPPRHIRLPLSQPPAELPVDCPGLRIDNWCVFLPNISAPSHTWRDAETQCNLHQGHLVVINDTTKQDFVMRLMAELNVTTTWIGGRLNVVNTWTWVSGTFSVSFTYLRRYSKVATWIPRVSTMSWIHYCYCYCYCYS